MNGLIGFAAAVALAACMAGGAATVHAMGGPDPEEALTDAVAAIERKDFDEAIQLLDVVLNEDSRNADALNWLGYSFRNKGDYPKALDYYRQALEVDPDHRGANEYIGEAFLDLKQPRKARQHLDRLAKLCGPGCEEYKDLKAAFEAYTAKSAGNRPHG